MKLNQTFVACLFAMAFPACASPGDAVQAYFGAFKCVAADGSTREAMFGPASRDPRALADPVRPLTFGWSIVGPQSPVTAIVTKRSGIEVNGVAGGTLALALIREKPDMDEDLDPFLTVAEQDGRVYFCGYNAP